VLLKNTISHVLLIQPTTALKLHTFNDADWASDHEDRQSVGAYCVYLGKNLVSWGCNQQQTVARSSIELNIRLLKMLLQKFSG
jgi:hypothetical protein